MGGQKVRIAQKRIGVCSKHTGANLKELGKSEQENNNIEFLYDKISNYKINE